MSTRTSSDEDPEIKRVLTYWFPTPTVQTKWYQGGPTVDAEIRTQFEPLVIQARKNELTETWTKTPKGALALLILLDQFPRNMYRGSGESYSSDPLAHSIALLGLAKGQDREVDYLEQNYFYLPLMHREDLTSQIACLALYEGWRTRCSADEEFVKQADLGIEMAKRHLHCILTFGRFPARNKPLGRELTEEEKKFLEENPHGF